MAEQIIQFRVYRYKPEDDTSKPAWRTFDVVVDEGTTVLVALQQIRHTQDPTLALRHSCHHAACGTCGMRVNGLEVLACVTNVLDLGTHTVTVEPLANLPLISDLVVDMSAFTSRYALAGMPYIRQSEFLPRAVPPRGVAGFNRYENCLECGLCFSACPVAGGDTDYLGPAAMAAAWRVVAEPRGHDPQEALEWVDQAHGCWQCHVAFECSEVCPADVQPAESIMALRRQISRHRFGRLLGIGVS